MTNILVLYYSTYGSRQPGDTELSLARFQGRHAASVAARLAAA